MSYRFNVEPTESLIPGQVLIWLPKLVIRNLRMWLERFILTEFFFFLHGTGRDCLKRSTIHPNNKSFSTQTIFLLIKHCLYIKTRLRHCPVEPSLTGCRCLLKQWHKLGVLTFLSVELNRHQKWICWVNTLRVQVHFSEYNIGVNRIELHLPLNDKEHHVDNT